MLQQEQPAANIYMELNFLKRLVFPTEEVFPVHNDFGEEKDTLFIDIIPIEFRFLSIDSNGKCDSGECVCALFSYAPAPTRSVSIFNRFYRLLIIK